MDSDDQLRLIKRLSKEMGLDESRWPARQFQWYINEQKTKVCARSTSNRRVDQFKQVMLKMYQAYEQACERGGMIDFGELLLRALELLRDRRPNLLAHYQERFRYTPGGRVPGHQQHPVRLVAPAGGVTIVN